MSSPAAIDAVVRLRGEQTGGQGSVIEITVYAGWPGPPLHVHDFDEAFYVLEGELTFQVGQDLLTKTSGELAFVPRGVPHHAREPKRATRALPPDLHTRRLRALLRPPGCRTGRSRAAALGASTEPRGRCRRPTNRRGGVMRDAR